MKGATIMILIWGSMLLVIIILFIRSWLFGTKYKTSDDPNDLK